MENVEFSQQLNDMDTNTSDLSFEARKRRSSRGRRRLTRVSKNRPKGRVVYSKDGRRLVGRYVRK